jgi:hypothetical protein
MNEWELLVIATDIEPGDTLIVEDKYNWKVNTEMVLLKTKKRLKTSEKDDTVVLMDLKRKKYNFKMINLELIPKKSDLIRWVIRDKAVYNLDIRKEVIK